MDGFLSALAGFVRRMALGMVLAFPAADATGAGALDAAPHYGAVGREALLLRIDNVEALDAKLAEVVDGLRGADPDADNHAARPLRELFGAFLHLPEYQQYLPHADGGAWLELALLAPVTPGEGARVVAALPVTDPTAYRAALVSRPGYEEVGGAGTLRHYRAYGGYPPTDWHLGVAAERVVVFSNDRAATAAITAVYDQLPAPEHGRWPPAMPAAAGSPFAPDAIGDAFLRRRGEAALRGGDLRLRLWGAPWTTWPAADDEQNRSALDRFAAGLRLDLADAWTPAVRADAAHALAGRIVDDLLAVAKRRTHAVEAAFYFQDDALRVAADWRTRPEGGGDLGPAAPAAVDDGRLVAALDEVERVAAAVVAGRTPAAAASAVDTRALAGRLPAEVVSWHALAPSPALWRAYADYASWALAWWLGGFLPPAAQRELDGALSALDRAGPGGLAAGWLPTGGNGEDFLVVGVWRFADPAAASLPTALEGLLRRDGPLDEVVAAAGHRLLFSRDAPGAAVAADGDGVVGLRLGLERSAPSPNLPPTLTEAERMAGARKPGDFAGEHRLLLAYRDGLWYFVADRARPEAVAEAAAEATRRQILAAMTAPASASPPALSAADWTLRPADAARPGVARSLAWGGSDPWATGRLSLARLVDWRPLAPDETPPPYRRDVFAWSERPPTMSGRLLWRWTAGAGGAGLGLDVEVPWPVLFSLAAALGVGER